MHLPKPKDANTLLAEHLDSKMDDNWKGKICCLSHVSSHCWTDLAEGRVDKELQKDPIPADDAIVVPLELIRSLGFDLPPDTPEYLPTCPDCFKALLDASLILCWCLDCDSSAWITKMVGKRYPDGDIFYQKGCQHCCPEGKKGFIVFIDSILDRIKKGSELTGFSLDQLPALSAVIH